MVAQTVDILAAGYGLLLLPIVGGIILLVVAVLFVVFPIVIFISAMWERQHLRLFVPVAPEKMPATGTTYISDATAHGFTHLGVWDDGDKGIAKGVRTLLLSPD